jgi:hypothetical protein
VYNSLDKSCFLSHVPPAAASELVDDDATTTAVQPVFSEMKLGNGIIAAAASGTIRRFVVYLCPGVAGDEDEGGDVWNDIVNDVMGATMTTTRRRRRRRIVNYYETPSITAARTNRRFVI